MIHQNLIFIKTFLNFSKRVSSFQRCLPTFVTLQSMKHYFGGTVYIVRVNQLKKRAKALPRIRSVSMN